MRAYLLLCIAAVLVGAVCAECDACIDSQCYRKNRLPLSGTSDYLMDIYRNTNTLYVRGRGIIKQCQLDTAICNDTASSWNIKRLTVDQHTGDIYGRVDDIGTNGLYKLDLVNKEKTLLIRDDGAYYTIFKDKLYYTLWSGNRTFSFVDGESRQVAGTEKYVVIYFIVDNKDDIYFTTFFNNRYEIRRLTKGVSAEVWDDSYVITVDRDGNAVFIHKKSRAVYRVKNGQQVEVGTINDSILILYYFYDTPLFDRDNNIIYKNYNQEIFHLKQERGVYCTTSVLQNKRIITETVVGNEDNYDLVPRRSVNTDYH